MLRREYWDGVEVISVDEYELIRRLEEIATRIRIAHPEVQEIVLFGSFARGDFTPRSDIDVALVLERSEKPFLERADVFADAFTGLPLDVNLVVYTREELERMWREGNPLAQAIVDGIRL